MAPHSMISRRVLGLAGLTAVVFLGCVLLVANFLYNIARTDRAFLPYHRWVQCADCAVRIVDGRHGNVLLFDCPNNVERVIVDFGFSYRRAHDSWRTEFNASKVIQSLELCWDTNCKSFLVWTRSPGRQHPPEELAIPRIKQIFVSQFGEIQNVDASNRTINVDAIFGVPMILFVELDCRLFPSCLIAWEGSTPRQTLANSLEAFEYVPSQTNKIAKFVLMDVAQLERRSFEFHFSRAPPVSRSYPTLTSLNLEYAYSGLELPTAPTFRPHSFAYEIAAVGQSSVVVTARPAVDVDCHFVRTHSLLWTVPGTIQTKFKIRQDKATLVPISCSALGQTSTYVLFARPNASGTLGLAEFEMFGASSISPLTNPDDVTYYARLDGPRPPPALPPRGRWLAVRAVPKNSNETKIIFDGEQLLPPTFLSTARRVAGSSQNFRFSSIFSKSSRDVTFVVDGGPSETRRPFPFGTPIFVALLVVVVLPAYHFFALSADCVRTLQILAMVCTLDGDSFPLLRLFLFLLPKSSAPSHRILFSDPSSDFESINDKLEMEYLTSSFASQLPLSLTVLQFGIIVFIFVFSAGRPDKLAALARLPQSNWLQLITRITPVPLVATLDLLMLPLISHGIRAIMGGKLAIGSMCIAFVLIYFAFLFFFLFISQKIFVFSSDHLTWHERTASSAKVSGGLSSSRYCIPLVHPPTFRPLAALRHDDSLVFGPAAAFGRTTLVELDGIRFSDLPPPPNRHIARQSFPIQVASDMHTVTCDVNCQHLPPLLQALDALPLRLLLSSLEFNVELSSIVGSLPPTKFGISYLFFERLGLAVVGTLLSHPMTRLFGKYFGFALAGAEVFLLSSPTWRLARAKFVGTGDVDSPLIDSSRPTAASRPLRVRMTFACLDVVHSKVFLDFSLLLCFLSSIALVHSSADSLLSTVDLPPLLPLVAVFVVLRVPIFVLYSLLAAHFRDAYLKVSLQDVGVKFNARMKLSIFAPTPHVPTTSAPPCLDLGLREFLGAGRVVSALIRVISSTGSMSTTVGAKPVEVQPAVAGYSVRYAPRADQLIVTSPHINANRRYSIARIDFGNNIHTQGGMHTVEGVCASPGTIRASLPPDLPPPDLIRKFEVRSRDDSFLVDPSRVRVELSHGTLALFDRRFQPFATFQISFFSFDSSSDRLTGAAGTSQVDGRVALQLHSSIDLSWCITSDVSTTGDESNRSNVDVPWSEWDFVRPGEQREPPNLKSIRAIHLMDESSGRATTIVPIGTDACDVRWNRLRLPGTVIDCKSNGSVLVDPNVDVGLARLRASVEVLEGHRLWLTSCPMVASFDILGSHVKSSSDVREFESFLHSPEYVYRLEQEAARVLVHQTKAVRSQLEFLLKCRPPLQLDKLENKILNFLSRCKTKNRSFGTLLCVDRRNLIFPEMTDALQAALVNHIRLWAADELALKTPDRLANRVAALCADAWDGIRAVDLSLPWDVDSTIWRPQSLEFRFAYVRAWPSQANAPLHVDTRDATAAVYIPCFLRLTRFAVWFIVPSAAPSSSSESLDDDSRPVWRRGAGWYVPLGAVQKIVCSTTGTPAESLGQLTSTITIRRNLFVPIDDNFILRVDDDVPDPIILCANPVTGVLSKYNLVLAKSAHLDDVQSLDDADADELRIARLPRSQQVKMGLYRMDTVNTAPLSFRVTRATLDEWIRVVRDASMDQLPPPEAYKGFVGRVPTAAVDLRPPLFFTEPKAAVERREAAVRRQTIVERREREEKEARQELEDLQERKKKQKEEQMSKLRLQMAQFSSLSSD